MVLEPKIQWWWYHKRFCFLNAFKSTHYLRMYIFIEILTSTEKGSWSSWGHISSHIHLFLHSSKNKDTRSWRKKKYKMTDLVLFEHYKYPKKGWVYSSGLSGEFVLVFIVDSIYLKHITTKAHKIIHKYSSWNMGFVVLKAFEIYLLISLKISHVLETKRKTRSVVQRFLVSVVSLSE